MKPTLIDLLSELNPERVGYQLLHEALHKVKLVDKTSGTFDVGFYTDALKLDNGDRLANVGVMLWVDREELIRAETAVKAKKQENHLILKEQIPVTNEIWEHHSGTLYKIICVANEKSSSWETRVVYRDTDGDVWDRPLMEFLQKFKLSPTLPPLGAFGERVHGRVTVTKSYAVPNKD